MENTTIKPKYVIKKYIYLLFKHKNRSPDKGNNNHSQSYAKKVLSKSNIYLFHVQLAGFQPAYTITILPVPFEYFVWEGEVAIRRCSFNQNSRKLSVKKLICSKVMRSQPASLRKKNFFTHIPLSTLLSHPQNASRLHFPKKLWNCANILSFRKYKWKVALLVFYLFNYRSSKLTCFM